MARPLRITFPGAVYHITSRGNAQNLIFLEDKDYYLFLSIIKKVIRDYNWLCHAYCLMPNHYHLLVETLESNLPFGMRHINGVYTQSFNWNHKRVGHIFQGRYKSILVEKESYLLELVRYIMLNPIRAGIAKNLSVWRWSSYATTISEESNAKFVTTDWILNHFSNNQLKARKIFEEYVSEGLDLINPLKNLVGGSILGSSDFIKKHKNSIEKYRNVKEIVRQERYVDRPALQNILKKTTLKNRGKQLHEAHVTYGYTLSEISRYLSIHYSTISKDIKKYEGNK